MFSFLVLHIAQLGTIVRNLDISVNEIIDVTAVQDRQRQWGLLFVTVAPPESLEVVKALARSSEHFLMWLYLVLSVHM